MNTLNSFRRVPAISLYLIAFLTTSCMHAQATTRLTFLSQLHSDGCSVGANPHSVGSHDAPVHIERVQVAEGDGGGEGVSGREGSVGVHFSHTHGVVLDGPIGVLEGGRAPGDGEGGGGSGAGRELLGGSDWCCVGRKDWIISKASRKQPKIVHI